MNNHNDSSPAPHQRAFRMTGRLARSGTARRNIQASEHFDHEDASSDACFSDPVSMLNTRCDELDSNNLSGGGGDGDFFCKKKRSRPDDGNRTYELSDIPCTISGGGARDDDGDGMRDEEEEYEEGFGHDPEDPMRYARRFAAAERTGPIHKPEPLPAKPFAGPVAAAAAAMSTSHSPARGLGMQPLDDGGEQLMRKGTAGASVRNTSGADDSGSMNQHHNVTVEFPSDDDDDAADRVPDAARKRSSSSSISSRRPAPYRYDNGVRVEDVTTALDLLGAAAAAAAARRSGSRASDSSCASSRAGSMDWVGGSSSSSTNGSAPAASSSSGAYFPPTRNLLSLTSLSPSTRAFLTRVFNNYASGGRGFSQYRFAAPRAASYVSSLPRMLTQGPGSSPVPQPFPILLPWKTSSAGAAGASTSAQKDSLLRSTSKPAGSSAVAAARLLDSGRVEVLSSDAEDDDDDGGVDSAVAAKRGTLGAAAAAAAADRTTNRTSTSSGSGSSGSGNGGDAGSLAGVTSQAPDPFLAFAETLAPRKFARVDDTELPESTAAAPPADQRTRRVAGAAQAIRESGRTRGRDTTMEAASSADRSDETSTSAMRRGKEDGAAGGLLLPHQRLGVSRRELQRQIRQSQQTWLASAGDSAMNGSASFDEHADEAATTSNGSAGPTTAAVVANNEGTTAGASAASADTAGAASGVQPGKRMRWE